MGLKKELTEEQKERKKVRDREWKRKNKDKVADQFKKWYEVNKDHDKDRCRIYNENHREEARLYSRKNYEENKEKEKARAKKYRDEHKEELSIKQKIRKQKPEVQERRRKSSRLRTKNDIQHRIACNGRLRRWQVLKSQSVKKQMSYEESLGCTVEFFKRYIESLWLPNMDWGNYGCGKDKWHLDEIKPCAAFDLSDPEQYKACFHYTNCQPLWDLDNKSKGSLYEGKRHSHKDKINKK